MALGLVLVLALAPAASRAEPDECAFWDADPKTSGANEEYLPTPDPDPFYVQPDPMPCTPLGTILDWRPITFTPTPGLALPNDAWHLKFLSTDPFGAPIAAVASVVKPLPEVTSATPKLLAHQFFENSLGSVCAPSHTVTGATDNLESTMGSPFYLTGPLALGWTLVIPDHEGPLTTYGAPITSGRITLDAIRAAEGFASLSLVGSATPVALWGFSSGATASIWAAAMAPTYAPELNIVGAAGGGTLLDVGDFFASVDGHPFWMRYAFSGMIGITRVYEDFVPVSLLNEAGLEMARAVKDGCNGQRTDGGPAPSGHFSDFVIEDPFGRPQALATYAATALPRPDAIPTADVYLYHSTDDELAPMENVHAAARAWCEHGTRVVVNELPGTHVTAGFSGLAGAIRFLTRAFDGLDPQPEGTERGCA
ncbi:MAG TPA: lipase family protein [Actinomycetota bacterium]